MRDSTSRERGKARQGRQAGESKPESGRRRDDKRAESKEQKTLERRGARGVGKGMENNTRREEAEVQ